MLSATISFFIDSKLISVHI